MCKWKTEYYGQNVIVNRNAFTDARGIEMAGKMKRHNISDIAECSVNSSLLGEIPIPTSRSISNWSENIDSVVSGFYSFCQV